jgi:hypothetical protein
VNTQMIYFTNYKAFYKKIFDEKTWRGSQLTSSKNWDGNPLKIKLGLGPKINLLELQ